MGLFSSLRSKPVAAFTPIGNIAVQLSKISFCPDLKGAVEDAFSFIKTEEQLFMLHSRQINQLKTEIETLNKGLKETKDKDQKDNLKKQIKDKEKEILNFEMKNFKSLLVLLGSLKTIIKAIDAKKPSQSLVDSQNVLERAIFDLTVILEGKLKPIVKNSVFTLIGKMAEKDLDIAYAAAKAVFEEPHRSWSLVEVAEKAVAANPSRALKIIDEIEDKNAQSLAYSKVTAKLTQGSNAENTRWIAMQFREENARRWALGQIPEKK